MIIAIAAHRRKHIVDQGSKDITTCVIAKLILDGTLIHLSNFCIQLPITRHANGLHSCKELFRIALAVIHRKIRQHIVLIRSNQKISCITGIGRIVSATITVVGILQLALEIRHLNRLKNTVFIFFVYDIAAGICYINRISGLISLVNDISSGSRQLINQELQNFICIAAVIKLRSKLLTDMLLIAIGYRKVIQELPIIQIISLIIHVSIEIQGIRSGQARIIHEIAIIKLWISVRNALISIFRSSQKAIISPIIRCCSLFGYQQLQQSLRNLLDLYRPVVLVSIVIRQRTDATGNTHQVLRPCIALCITGEIVILHGGTIGHENANNVTIDTICRIFLADGITQTVCIFQADIIVGTQCFINIFVHLRNNAIHDVTSQGADIHKCIRIHYLRAGIDLRGNNTRVLRVRLIILMSNQGERTGTQIILLNEPVQMIIELIVRIKSGIVGYIIEWCISGGSIRHRVTEGVMIHITKIRHGNANILAGTLQLTDDGLQGFLHGINSALLTCDCIFVGIQTILHRTGKVHDNNQIDTSFLRNSGGRQLNVCNTGGHEIRRNGDTLLIHGNGAGLTCIRIA